MIKDLPEHMKKELGEVSFLYYSYILTKTKGAASIFELKKLLGITNEKNDEFWQIHSKLVKKGYINQHFAIMDRHQTEGFVHLTESGVDRISEYVDPVWLKDWSRERKELTKKFIPLVMTNYNRRNGSAPLFRDMNLNAYIEHGKKYYLFTFRSQPNPNKTNFVIIDPIKGEIVKKVIEY